jgi:hypothetical protein
MFESEALASFSSRDLCSSVMSGNMLSPLVGSILEGDHSHPSSSAKADDPRGTFVPLQIRGWSPVGDHDGDGSYSTPRKYATIQVSA